ncbi:hypothetical protein ASPWEDRAFT_112009 [Aspergillus wentii DTO 134E9]|uniref:NADH:flavin oxidoreductase/NADH oxidase N-terminal domain-containing protein n=1 Tax=Aspergillus wentii DTO 134E9 TaxID=1073089 RepID=A0A1L9RM78_ASPWE|nr:uncharacterized protein ASPWEDRAFT_112009 [Aspergillus wentii DTO 134E9]KAI9929555.1 hypothetical protein MW887_001028 [Aspergillus wentii]OJJ36004.1 hypothetical protein ASPWEDRAFT_112009 [Aspergillus wentii DTO 134E9]
MSSLFKPLHVGTVVLQHRIVMAPLSRFRTDENHVPLPMAVEYYAQRASIPGTLIIAEASIISPDHGGYPYSPGLWTEPQIARWKEITDAVHERGSYIFAQICAIGRKGDAVSVLNDGGGAVLSSSATPITPDGHIPREMTEAEIQSAIDDFVTAAKNAILAGFDGVEIHGANGYLVDQFTQDTCNTRTDRWGGSIPNRARFGIAVAKAVSDAVGPERTGFRISPFSTSHGMRMADPIPQFAYLIDALKDLRLSYLHVIESRVFQSFDVDKTDGIEFVLDIWGKTSPVFVAGGYRADNAMRAVEEYRGSEVAVVFGRQFIANPDLVFRIKEGIALNEYDRSTFYTQGQTKGYLDYPFSAEYLASIQV